MGDDPVVDVVTVNVIGDWVITHLKSCRCKCCVLIVLDFEGTSLHVRVWKYYYNITLLWQQVLKPARGGFGLWELGMRPNARYDSPKCIGTHANGVGVVPAQVTPSAHSISSSLKPALTYGTIHIAVTSFCMCHGYGGLRIKRPIMLPVVADHSVVYRILAQNVAFIINVKQVAIQRAILFGVPP